MTSEFVWQSQTQIVLRCVPLLARTCFLDMGLKTKWKKRKPMKKKLNKTIAFLTIPGCAPTKSHKIVLGSARNCTGLTRTIDDDGLFVRVCLDRFWNFTMTEQRTSDFLWQYRTQIVLRCVPLLAHTRFLDMGLETTWKKRRPIKTQQDNCTLDHPRLCTNKIARGLFWTR